MRRKSKDSKMNVVLTSLLVVFVCLLSFSIGVIFGKGWSDREYKVRHIENDSHLKAAMEDNEPIGDEMTQKEVELLTQRALEEAKAQVPQPEESSDSAVDTQASQEKEIKRNVAAADKKETASDEKESKEDKNSEPKGREASTAQAEKKDVKRKVSSLPPQPSTPKPESIEYTVQVAAYKELKDAEIHCQKLIDKGFPAFPVKAMIKGKPWYRVSIGSFKSRKAAMKYNKALLKQAAVKDTFVQRIKRVK